MELFVIAKPLSRMMPSLSVPNCRPSSRMHEVPMKYERAPVEVLRLVLCGMQR